METLPFTPGSGEEFAFGLKLHRERLGMTQAALAKYLHGELATIRDWEQGRRTPSPMLQRLVLKELRNAPVKG